MHQRSSVGDGRFLPTSSDVTNQWPGLVCRRCCQGPVPLASRYILLVGGKKGPSWCQMLRASAKAEPAITFKMQMQNARAMIISTKTPIPAGRRKRYSGYLI
ncbi:hypothetical protein TNCV_4788401 [Trichonephila clavipes]|nr:hypothetical protein TNCV_4788401 [Trichonephila clavipes]